ncbi:hypothetical protein JYU34_014845 [Plutella xylostella]|uniref:Uncharacterized protein n=1 Tax=Plutella xylostella TaxID=51655 RepID=A0ABQ7Q9A5_PLUXY|nr:hypothetical protein JYU34_014845 [Plutella xylostella]
MSTQNICAYTYIAHAQRAARDGDAQGLQVAPARATRATRAGGRDNSALLRELSDFYSNPPRWMVNAYAATAALPN